MRADVDLYLTVARRLLGDTAAAPSRGPARRRSPSCSTSRCRRAACRRLALFGGSRDVDFTQFKPRGHYAGDSRLEPYFRAMIWLGRTDLRFLQYDTFAPPGRRPAFTEQFLAACCWLAAGRQGRPGRSGSRWTRSCAGSWASPTTWRSPTSRGCEPSGRGDDAELSRCRTTPGAGADRRRVRHPAHRQPDPVVPPAARTPARPGVPVLRPALRHRQPGVFGGGVRSRPGDRSG